MFNASPSTGLHIGTLMGVPVRISMWFFLLIGYYSWSVGDPQIAIIWGVAITLSILVHEFGHATFARYYRLNPSVLLHGFGGLCMHDRSERDRHDALILIAGPGFGFLLGALTYLAYLAIMTWAPHWNSPHLHYAYYAMIWINILWSGVNLIPLWPLDGGQLFRLALLQKLNPTLAEKITHGVGFTIGAAAAIYSYRSGWPLVAVLAGYFAYLNYAQLNSSRASGPIRPKSNFAKALLADANAALEAEDWHEAARLTYQIRDLKQSSDKVIRRSWEILTIATAYQDDYEQALRYARKVSKESDEMLRAQAHCLMGLDRPDEAKAMLERLSSPH